MNPAHEVRMFEGARRVDGIAADDRAFAYGEGLFETLRAHAGSLPWWDAHWARLAHGAQRLGLPLPDPAHVRAEADAMFADGGNGVLKLLLSRGGVRGYAPPADAAPRWMLARHPLPPAHGAVHAIWCHTRLALQPALAGLKHCNRLEQVLARRECDAAGADEGLMQDSDGHVVSATAANLFVLRNGAWTTPPVDRCGVAGICRAHLLVALGAREARLDREAVETADAVFLCNAVRGILPVARLGARQWASHPAIRDARQALARSHPGLAPEAGGHAVDGHAVDGQAAEAG
ncbi:MAG TPA: aminodeoxychorismate lyase [Luteimonas sp.]|nr:aminodeoxychorismate lyase [Luteimonas sp.]